ncbi:MAG: T9SS type A sorting domain-containing protein [Candidatus Marinimicrobia bacterium]|nr:T9SS type A sorting domain-containing protein [Candidatus Neomarinimicrobiota bacterium]
MIPPERDVDHYEIYCDYGNGSFSKIGESTTAEYTDLGTIIGHPKFGLGEWFTYKCLAVDVTDQESIFSNLDLVYISGISKKSHEGKNVENPLISKISEAYPNPFNPNTSIPIALSETSFLTVKIFNINGVKVSNMVPGQVLDAGYYEFDWSGKTNNGNSLPSGLYLCKIIINSQNNEFVLSETLKLMYAK